MPRHIVQALLRHSVNDLFVLPRQPCLQRRNPQADGRRVEFLEARSQLAQRRTQAQPFHHSGTQGGDDPPQLGHNHPRYFAGLSQPWSERARSLALHHLQLQTQEEKTLAGLVVQFAADPASLFLLRASRLRVQAAHFDESTGRWQITTDKGGASARFFILASGCLSSTNVPDFKGLSDFKGDWYHTGGWPHDGGTSLFSAWKWRSARAAICGTCVTQNT
jgi:hypothetical protein